MIIYTVYYGDVYRRLARVLGRSIKDNCPDTQFICDIIPVAGQLPYAPKHTTDNTAKLEAWNAFAQQADDNLVLLDADMLVLGDLAAAFDDDDEWDVAYTVRPGPRRIQGGAVYLRPTDAARQFMAEWTACNAQILADEAGLRGHLEVYGGVNQAALGLLVEKYGNDGPIRLQQLPCEIYNCCKQTWEAFSPDTAVVHLTGRLRRQACECRMPLSKNPEWTPRERNIIAAWLYYAR